MMGEMLYGTEQNNGLFNRFFYLWVIILWASFWPVLDVTIGLDSLEFRKPPKPSIINNLVYYLTYNPEWFKVFYFGLLVSALLSFFRVFGVAARAGVWVFQLVLYINCYSALNGGVYLASSWAFLMIFSFPRATQPWVKAISQLSYLGARIQFLIAYFFAGYYKWQVEDWLEGRAVRYLAFNEYLTPEWLMSFYLTFPGFGQFLNYLMMVYLITFPFLIFVKKVKPILMLIGTVFHLYTAFVMGLADFGLLMLIGYILFLDKSSVSALQRRFSGFLDRILNR